MYLHYYASTDVILLQSISSMWLKHCELHIADPNDPTQEKMAREVFDRNICEKDKIFRDVFFYCRSLIVFNYEENVLKHQYINVFLNWSRMDTFHIYEIQSPSRNYKQNI